MKTYKFIIGVLVILLTFSACEEELTIPEDYMYEYDQSQAPQVSNDQLIKVSATYATLAATADTGYVDRGFIIDTLEDFSTQMVIPATAGTDEFEVTATDLKENKTYYYKSFATTIMGGTTTGDVGTFTTKESVTPFSISYDKATVEEWESAGFSTIDKDGDGNDWSLTYYDEEAGQVAFISYSWLNEPLTPENYLVYPELELSGIDGLLSFTVQAGDPNFPNETLKLVASTTPITEDNVADAEVLYTTTLQDGEAFTASINIPTSYQGGNLYLALAHTDVTDMFSVYFLSTTFSYVE